MILIALQPDQWTLGIDTSAYTTSVAAVGADGRWVRQERRVLPVPIGSRGLRPGDAVFHHVRNLPVLVRTVLDGLSPAGLAGIAVSTAPRPVPDSYLPPFLAGMAVAESLAALNTVPLLRTTHQEGHIRAGLAGANMAPAGPFLAVHVSGGTTELVSVDPGVMPWRIELLGGSDDLYAGQFVDRIGVLLGLSFPAGPELDQLAESTEESVPLPYSRPRQRDGQWWTSFSGPESAAERAVASGASPAMVARGVMTSIGQSLCALAESTGRAGDLLVVGGVAANTHLRRMMRQRLEPRGWQVRFAPPEWSRDNAVGVAFLMQDALFRGGNGGEQQ